MKISVTIPFSIVTRSRSTIVSSRASGEHTDRGTVLRCLRHAVRARSVPPEQPPAGQWNFIRCLGDDNAVAALIPPYLRNVVVPQVRKRRVQYTIPFHAGDSGLSTVQCVGFAVCRTAKRSTISFSGTYGSFLYRTTGFSSVIGSPFCRASLLPISMLSDVFVRSR